MQLLLYCCNYSTVILRMVDAVDLTATYCTLDVRNTDRSGAARARHHQEEHTTRTTPWRTIMISFFLLFVRENPSVSFDSDDGAAQGGPRSRRRFMLLP